MHKNKILILGIFISLIMMGIPINADDYPPASPNFMGFDGDADVTLGATVYIDIYVDVHSEIDTASVDNMTYTPGILDYESNTVFGDLFPGSVVQITPEGGGVIDNVNGYCNPIVWGSLTSVNNTNSTHATCEWTAVDCGTTTLAITAGGTALSGIDPGTTFRNMDVRVHPQGVASLDVTVASATQLDLSWVKSSGMDKTLIRFRTDTFPTSVTDGTEVYNGTGTSTNHGSLTPGLTYYYSAWGWNETAGLYSIGYMTESGVTNSPPVFGTPSPTNGSIDQELSLTWQIPITDPEGDWFNWSIHCSDGHQLDVSGEYNGTKQLFLDVLDYSTTYTMWVNATDSGSGATTSEWFDFTTKSNTLPTITNENPTNGSAGQEWALTWSCVITDPDETMDWDIECNNGQSLSGTSSSGTISLALTGLSASTVYTVWVNVTDGFDTVAEWFDFTTKANTPPDVPSNPNPPDSQSNWNPKNDRLHCYVEDDDGHSMTVTFYWGNGTIIGTDTVASQGIARVSGFGLDAYTSYNWYAVADDGHGGSTKGPAVGNWTFTTGKERGGGRKEGDNVLTILVLGDGIPLGDAIITINQGTSPAAIGGFVTTASTEASGYQEFYLPDGNYIITCTAPEYGEQQIHVQVTGDSSQVLYMSTPEEVSLILLFLILLLLILAAIVTLLIKDDRIKEAPGMAFVFILNASAFILGLFNYIIFVPIAAILLLIEFLWIKKVF